MHAYAVFKYILFMGREKQHIGRRLASYKCQRTGFPRQFWGCKVFRRWLSAIVAYVDTNVLDGVYPPRTSVE